MKLKFGQRILSGILCSVLFLNNFSCAPFIEAAYADETIGIEETQSSYEESAEEESLPDMMVSSSDVQLGEKKEVSESLERAFLTKWDLLETNRQVNEDGIEKIDYTLEYSILTTNVESLEEAEMEFEFLLPADETVAGWEIDSMNLWMEPDWTIEMKERSFDFNGDGAVEAAFCQILKGSMKVDAPVDGVLSVSIYVNQSEEELVMEPVFTAWMKHNRAGSEELGMVEATGNELPCQEHGNVEQLTCIARTSQFDAPLVEEIPESTTSSDCSTEIFVSNVTTTEGETATDHVTKYIDYELNYEVAASSLDAMEDGTLTIEMLLPLEKERAVWGTETVEQLLADGWMLVTEERTVDFDGDGRDETAACQILKGSISINADTAEGCVKTTIHVLDMEDGQVVQPIFQACVGHEMCGFCRAETISVCRQPLEQVESVPVVEEQSYGISAITLSAKEIVDFEVAVEEPVLWNNEMIDFISISKLIFDDETTEINPSVTVTSPGWPNNYENNLKEAQTAQIIEIPGATKLKITFDSTSQTESVRYDWIVGYDRDGNVILEKLGGTDFAGKTYTVVGDYIKLAFRTDGSGCYKGFSATIEGNGILYKHPFTVTPSIVPETYDPFDVTVSLDGTNVKKTVSVRATDAIWIKEIGNSKRSDIQATLYCSGRLVLEGTGAVSNDSTLLKELCDLRIKEVVVGEGITDIASLCQNMSNVETVSLPNSLVGIGNSAFSGCSNIRTIEIPEGVTSIGNSAFSNCSSLESVKLPKNLTSIGNSAFYKCGNIKTIEIPEGVTSIGNSAFSDCSSLESVKLPKKLTSIGNYAFYKCGSIKTIEIPEGVTSIGSSAFSDCSSLESVKLPKKLTSIGNYAFYKCGSIKTIEIPEGVTSIGNSAFRDCSGLETVKLPKNLTTISSAVFEKCKSLETIEIPDSVTRIAEDAFEYCYSVKTVIIGSGLTSIPSWCFESTIIEEITIPSNVISVGSNSLPRTLEKIITSASALSEKSLQQCSALWKATLKGGTLAEQIFGNTCLQDLTIDGDIGVTAENALLADYSNLPLSLHVTSQTNNIDASFWKAAAKRGVRTLTFEGEQVISLNGISSCGIFTYKNMVDGTYYIDSLGNFWLLNEENQTAVLALVAEGQDTLTIPTAVKGYTITGVAGNVFVACREICSVMFEKPENITAIGVNAFANCRKLTQINGLNKTSQINALFA